MKLFVVGLYVFMIGLTGWAVDIWMKLPLPWYGYILMITPLFLVWGLLVMATKEVWS